jgi:uncharacterized protein
MTATRHRGTRNIASDDNDLMADTPARPFTRFFWPAPFTIPRQTRSSKTCRNDNDLVANPPRSDAEHPNATAYRRAAAAFRAGDLAAIEALVDADVVWHVPGSHPLAGDLRGREALMAFLTRVGELGFWLREHDVFGNDAHVCVLSEMGATRPGVSVSTRVVSIFHFRDGRQVERWFYPEDPHAWNTILGST